MLSELHQKSNLYLFLHKIDTDLSERCRLKGCPDCSSPLHRAYYERKPRGGPELPAALCIRMSLCCSKEGCRHRLLPPSCLFLGRRVYWGLVILLLTALHQKRPKGQSTQRLVDKFGIDRKTFFRWVVYYRDIFPESPCWHLLRNRFPATVSNTRLPGDALDAFIAHARDPVTGVAKLLALYGKGLFFQDNQGRIGFTQKMGLSIKF